jgi:Ca2+-binding EF-hand superfamily protein
MEAKTMKKLLLGGVAAATIIAAGTAFADTAQASKTVSQTSAKPAHKRPPMRSATRADVQARVGTIFARLDTNHDGFITKEELSARDAAREQRAQQRAARFDPSKFFDRLDLNHDGKVTTAEAESARSQHSKAKGGKPAEARAAAFGGLFERADTNRDGVITRAEFDVVGQKMKARVQHAGMARGGMEARMFDTSDANKDGRISLSEMQQAALARFDRLDLNHDGAISKEERQKAHQQFKRPGKPQ